ncbi:hypothetical protein PAPYR_12740 [Paratrimastix pyriformis]|uniref:Fibronectin type-III domain-containing protein n=1 Tax=Paratrimastix pyriformis TaxID=342808 RepID=A0ABQ8U1E5_9EUKA|nr:hypothetical protein PAPYR_12740 [Paratrimastix pyriformis]
MDSDFLILCFSARPCVIYPRANDGTWNWGSPAMTFYEQGLLPPNDSATTGIHGGAGTTKWDEARTDQTSDLTSITSLQNPAGLLVATSPGPSVPSVPSILLHVVGNKEPGATGGGSRILSFHIDRGPPDSTWKIRPIPRQVVSAPGCSFDPLLAADPEGGGSLWAVEDCGNARTAVRLAMNAEGSLQIQRRITVPEECHRRYTLSALDDVVLLDCESSSKDHRALWIREDLGHLEKDNNQRPDKAHKGWELLNAIGEGRRLPADNGTAAESWRKRSGCHGAGNGVTTASLRTNSALGSTQAHDGDTVTLEFSAVEPFASPDGGQRPGPPTTSRRARMRVDGHGPTWTLGAGTRKALSAGAYLGQRTRAAHGRPGGRRAAHGRDGGAARAGPGPAHGEPGGPPPAAGGLAAAALAEDDAVTGPGCGTMGPCTSCAGKPAAVRLTGKADGAPPGRAAGDGGCLDVIALPAELVGGRYRFHVRAAGQNGTYSWTASRAARDGGQLGDALEDLALATVDEVAPTHARVHWPVVALQGTELAGLDDQVEYQVLAREVSLPGRAAARRCRWATATGRWSAPRAAPNGTAGDWWMRVDAATAPTAGGPQPGHRYEWKVRARLSGAGYLFGQSDAGSPTAAPEDVESSPTAETVVLPEQDLGQPTVSLVGPHRLRVAWQRQALAEDDAVTGPGPAAVRLTGATSADASAPVAELAGDGHTTALDVIALPAELLGDALEDLALATVDEVAPTHARVHWPVVALQGTELAGLDDQVEYQVLARERPGAAPTARRATGGCGSTRPRPPTAGALQPGHRYEWKVRARLSGAGYLFGQSDAGSPTAAPEDVESSPTAETVVLPEQDLGQPTRQALAEDDAVTGPGCGTTWARCTSCAGSPAAVRLTGPRAPTRAPRGRAGGRRAHDGPGCDCPAGRAASRTARDGGQLGDALEDLALATVDEVAPTHARVHWPVVALQGTELAGLDDQVEYQVLAREVSLPGAAARRCRWATATGRWSAGRPQRHGGRLPGHRYEWKVRARLSGAGYLFGQSDAGSPTAAPEDVESSPTAETVVLPEQDLGQPTRQALAEDDAVTGPGVRYHVWARCTSCAGSPAAVRLTGATSADASAPWPSWRATGTRRPWM